MELFQGFDGIAMSVPGFIDVSKQVAVTGLGVVSPVYWLFSRKRQRALKAARA